MLLATVILMLCGFGGMFIACWRHPHRDLSPLFESSLLIAVVGLALTMVVAVVEALQQLSALLLLILTGIPQ